MVDPTKSYKVTPLGERKMRKFNTTANRYRVHFQDLEIRNLPNILQSLRRLFSSVIKDLTGIDTFSVYGCCTGKINLSSKLFLNTL